MLTSSAELMATVLSVRQQLQQVEILAPETISDHIARTEKRFQLRTELAQLEQQLRTPLNAPNEERERLGISTPGNDEQRAAEQIGKLFCKCCLTLDLTIIGMQKLAAHPHGGFFKPQAEELIEALEACDVHFGDIADGLDAAFRVCSDDD